MILWSIAKSVRVSQALIHLYNFSVVELLSLG